jgi:hypothetical protein
MKQKAELRFSKGRLFYYKSGIFGFSSSFDYQFSSNSKTCESELSSDHIKPSKFNIEHTGEFSDQLSPSSFQDE